MSNKVVDWSKPIEAYHEDGRSFRAEIETVMEDGHALIKDAKFSDCPHGFRPDGAYSFFNADARHGSSLWRIRNVEPQEPPLPPEWAIEEVRKKCSLDTIGGSGAAPLARRIIHTFARYIAEHEEAPVDRANQIVEEWRASDAFENWKGKQIFPGDDTAYMDAAFARWLHDKGLLREVGE